MFECSIYILHSGTYLHSGTPEKRQVSDVVGQLFVNVRYSIVYVFVHICVMRNFVFIQTRKPRRFDGELPDISVSDLQFLQSFCPSEVQPLLR